MLVDELVEKMLQEHPKSRSDEKELYIAIFEQFQLHLTPHQKEIFKSLPAMESIRRERQKFQARGYYLADPMIKKARRYKSQRIQQIEPGASTKYLGQVLEGRQTSLV